ncbi:hypothetical protein AAHC03_04933 [Spirometra sp. Aus1]
MVKFGAAEESNRLLLAPKPPSREQIQMAYSNARPGSEEQMQVVTAVVNTAAVLSCRPHKNFSSDAVDPHNIKFIWRRAEDPTYLTFNHQRIIQDSRYQIPTAEFGEFKMDLEIKFVNAEDEGEYICLYRGANFVHSNHVYLRVLIPATINENGSSALQLVVREGATQKLTCNASGIPAPSLKWFFTPTDGLRRLLSPNEDNRFAFAGNTLIITNATRDLRGTFACIAYNGVLGKTSRTIHVDIYFAPVVIMGNRVISQSLHQKIIIKATVTGNPIYSLYWEFNGSPVRSISGDCQFTQPNQKYCVISDREANKPMVLKTMLTVNDLAPEDFGNYSCVVHSPYGEVKGTTEVIQLKTAAIKQYALPGVAKFFPHKAGDISKQTKREVSIVKSMPEKFTSNAPHPAPSFLALPYILPSLWLFQNLA